MKVRLLFVILTNEGRSCTVQSLKNQNTLFIMGQLETPKKSAFEIKSESNTLTAYGVGDKLSYKGEDIVEVIKVYTDDGGIPFYDIRFQDGREKQTTHEYLRGFGQENKQRNSTNSTTPSLWKLAGRSIRKGVASTNRSLNRGFSAVQEKVVLPQGELQLDLGDLKVYRPLDKIEGIIKIKLNEATPAQQLTVTLRATRPVVSDNKSIENIFNDEYVFDEEYVICGKQVYQPNEEVPFEIIVPRLGTKKNNSIVSSLVQEFKDLRFTGNASWTMFCSLKQPKGSWRNMYSGTFRIHVDD